MPQFFFSHSSSAVSFFFFYKSNVNVTTREQDFVKQSVPDFFMSQTDNK